MPLRIYQGSKINNKQFFIKTDQIFEAIFVQSEKQTKELKKFREKEHKESKKIGSGIVNIKSKKLPLRMYQSSKIINK